MRDNRTLANTPLPEIIEIAEEALSRKEWNKRRKAKQIKPATCKECGELFDPVRQWQMFCSNNCRMQYHVDQSEAETRILVEENKRLLQENNLLKQALKDKV